MPITNTNSSKANPAYYNDFMLFARDILIRLEEMTFDFSDFHKEIYEGLVTNRFVLVIMPRGHLKTTILNCYALWRLFRERNYELCMVSSTLDQSKKNLDWIQNTIEAVPWLKHLKPSDKETWNKTEIVTTNGNKCQVKPFKPSARGTHPNEVLYDDILRESDIDMEEIKNVFWDIFYPMGHTKNCKHLIVGTPLTNDDLFAEIEGKIKTGNKRWTLLKKKAIYTDDQGNKKVLWDKRFTFDELGKIKEDMGAYRFNREFLCDPASEGSGFFPQEFIMSATDDDLKFSAITKGEVTIGADFAMSESATGDYNVFTVVDSYKGEFERKLMHNGEIKKVIVRNPVVVKHIERYKGPVGQVRKIKELYDIYRPTRIIIDASNFGARFERDLRDEGLPIEAQDFQPSKRALLLANLRKLFETEDALNNPPRIVIPTSQDDFTFNKTKELIHELSGFRETKTAGGYQTIASSLAHDDTVMSLAMAVKNVDSFRNTPKKIFWEIRPQNNDVFK